jgi:hypothetical protein
MNVFTTEHPINSQPSFFDARTYPVLSFVWSSLTTALFLVPLVIGLCVYNVFTNAAEIGAEYEFPDSWTLFTAQVFAFCFLFASLLVAAYRLVEWHFTRKALSR